MEESDQSCELTDLERRDWLRLIRTEHIGPATFRQLVQKFGTAREALDQLPSLGSTKRKFRPPPEEAVLAELNAAEAINARYIATCEPDYPALLRHIHDPPPLICVCGDVSLFQKQSVAIVGARNASTAGRQMAGMLASDLGRSDVVIVSGLARGIDGAAHAAALETGTIAVVAGGIDVIYPPEHAELTRTIAQQGLLISEMPPGYRPTGRDFPRRNRIISGLSRGVVVVEAAQKSGTLITARYALEQGREVFAVPGSPLDPRSHGTNRLIRDGATLIETADDILESLQTPLRQPAFMESDDFADAELLAEDSLIDSQKEVLSLLSFTPTHRDALIRSSELPPHVINQVLLELVLMGDAEEHTGGRYTLSAS
ncbi:MAG: DNA-processing protein DprA [Aquisalinus sp.]|nr:DNA-processing protein DprA [Aquisalinus sp.]